MKWGIIGIAGLLCLGGAVFWWLGRFDDGAGGGPLPGRGGPVAVEALVVRQGDLAEELILPAQVDALQGVTLRAEVGGRVRQIGFVEGAEVEAGAVLVELDVREARAAVMRAKADVALAEATLGRVQAAFNDVAASALELDEAKARVALAQANLKSAEALFDRHAVRAPFAGTVGLRQVTVGQTVAAGEALVNVVDGEHLKLTLTLPEQALGEAVAGLPVRIKTAGGSLVTSLTAVDSLVAEDSRGLAARVVVGGEEISATGLRAGQFAEVAVPLVRARDAKLMPARALLPSVAGNRVYVVADNGKMAKAIPVSVLARVSETVAVEGVTAGMRVVVAGQHKLRGDEAAVRLVTPTEIEFVPSAREDGV